MSNKTKNKNAEFYTNDLISDSPNSSEKGDKGKRKQDGSGKGTRENKGRGGCSPEEQKESPTKTKKDNPYFYEYSEDFVDDNKNLKITENSKQVMVVLEIKPTSSKKIEKFVNSIRPGWSDHEVSGKRHHFYYMKSDFVDDANTPVANKLYRAMDQIMYCIDRQMNRLETELMKMNDRERDRLYNHPFLREFKIDMLP